MKRQFITFLVGDEIFAVDVMIIREIRVWSPVTRLPGVPAYVAGAINLRGAIVPVFDLGARLGWGATHATTRHVIIVVYVENKLQGLIVDAVSDIIDIEESDIQPAPLTSVDGKSVGIAGMATVGGGMAMILDLSAITADDLQDIANAA